MRSLAPCALAAVLCAAWSGLAVTGSNSAAQAQRPRSQELGILADHRIVESSGLACSYVNPGAFWTHNDAGGAAQLFLLGNDGTTVAAVHVDGANAVDWEDIASFRRAGNSYVLIGDVGDNERQRSATHDPCTLYIIEEPRLDPLDGTRLQVNRRVATTASLRFSYADGPRNCESVAVDAARGKVYLASKEKRQTPCHVYELALPASRVEASAVARRIGRLAIPTIVAMDISPDGHRAVFLAKKGRRAFEFLRRDGESWAAAFDAPPREIPLPKRRQGEAICYGRDGKGLYLTSEGRKQPFWEVVR